MADGAGAVAPLQNADDTGAANAGVDVETKLLKQLCHAGAGAVFIEAKLRVGVKVTPPLLHVFTQMIGLHEVVSGLMARAGSEGG